MPWKRVGPDDYVSPSGRHWKKRQIRAYLAKKYGKKAMPDTGMEQLGELLASSPEAYAYIKKCLKQAHEKGVRVGERQATERFDNLLNRFHALKSLNGSGDLFKAVFEESKHSRDHGKFSSHPGASGEQDSGQIADEQRMNSGQLADKPAAAEHPEAEKVKTLLSRVKEVPAALRERVSSFLQAKYHSLSQRYGETGAKAVLAATVALLPIPVPGTSLIPVALAEAILRIRNAVKGKDDKGEPMGKALPPELSNEELQQLAHALLSELYEACGESPPGEEPEADDEPSDTDVWEPDADAEPDAVVGKAVDADAVAAAMLEIAVPALELGEDPTEALERLREMIPEPVRKAWSEDKHPRDKGGRFISKDALKEAQSNPEKAKQLRERVRPEDAEKLEAVLSGKEDPGRTKRGQAKHEAGQRRVAKEETKKRADELISKLSDYHAKPGSVELTPEDLHALADHLPQMRVEDLRRARMAMRASFQGDRKKEQMVERLVAHAKGMAFDARLEEQGITGAAADEMRAAAGLQPSATGQKVPPAAADPKKDKTKKRNRVDTVIAKVIDFGGINPNSSALKDTYRSLGKAAEDGIPLAVFRKDGVNLDELAQELESAGYIKVPANMHGSDYVLDLIRDRAHTLAADLTKEYDRALEEHARLQQEAADYASQSEVAEAVRLGEEAGRAEAEKDALGEHGEGALPGPEVDTSFEFGANEPAPPPFTVRPTGDEDVPFGVYGPNGKEVATWGTQDEAQAHAAERSAEHERHQAEADKYKNAGSDTPLSGIVGTSKLPASATLGEVEAAARKRLGAKFGGVVKRNYGGSWQIEVLKKEHTAEGVRTGRVATYTIATPEADVAPAAYGTYHTDAAGRTRLVAEHPSASDAAAQHDYHAERALRDVGHMSSRRGGETTAGGHRVFTAPLGAGGLPTKPEGGSPSPAQARAELDARGVRHAAIPDDQVTGYLAAILDAERRLGTRPLVPTNKQVLDRMQPAIDRATGPTERDKRQERAIRRHLEMQAEKQAKEAATPAIDVAPAAAPADTAAPAKPNKGNHGRGRKKGDAPPGTATTHTA